MMSADKVTLNNSTTSLNGSLSPETNKVCDQETWNDKVDASCEHNETDLYDDDKITYTPVSLVKRIDNNSGVTRVNAQKLNTKVCEWQPRCRLSVYDQTSYIRRCTSAPALNNEPYKSSDTLRKNVPFRHGVYIYHSHAGSYKVNKFVANVCSIDSAGSPSSGVTTGNTEALHGNESIGVSVKANRVSVDSTQESSIKGDGQSWNNANYFEPYYATHNQHNSVVYTPSKADPGSSTNRNNSHYYNEFPYHSPHIARASFSTINSTSKGSVGSWFSSLCSPGMYNCANTNDDKTHDVAEVLANINCTEVGTKVADAVEQYKNDSEVYSPWHDKELTPLAKTYNKLVHTSNVTSRSCRCKHTRCLKLYCFCFSRGVLCDADICLCHNCENIKSHGKESRARSEAISEILDRRDNAFSARTRKRLSNRCSCKKSHCLHKYCDCVASGRRCSKRCICIDCENNKTIGLTTMDDDFAAVPV